MTTRTHPEEIRLRQLAEALTLPDPHIPRAARAGIDIAELKRAAALFRSVIFDGYFDPRPLDIRLTELAGILARQSARALATFRRGTTSDTAPAAGTSPSNAPTAGAVADTTPSTGTLPDNASGAAARRFGQETAERLLAGLPELRRRLGTDVRAVFDGDPAAASYEEVILCYPALTAMTHYRFAHALLRLGVPILPRLITEMAHSATGIDIHPGAEIGDYFSIDHGTGVVIGETTTIGEHVKLYQGVTLGAKSFELDEHGNPVKGIKRHPDIGNHVVVYAGATILGGMTHIGDNCVIGGNVWLTHSIEAGRTVLAAEERGTKII